MAVKCAYAATGYNWDTKNKDYVKETFWLLLCFLLVY